MGYRNYRLLSELEAKLEDDLSDGIIPFSVYKERLKKLYLSQRVRDIGFGYHNMFSEAGIDDDFDDQLGYDEYIENTSVARMVA